MEQKYDNHFAGGQATAIAVPLGSVKKNKCGQQSNMPETS